MKEIINVKTIEKFEREGKKIIELKTEGGKVLGNISYGETPNYKEGCEIIINLDLKNTI